MKNLFVLIFISLLFNIASFSQISGELKEKFIDAEYYYLYEDFTDALPIYLEIAEKYPGNSNVNYRIGMCFLHLPQVDDKARENAIKYLKKGTKEISERYNEGSYKETGSPPEVFFYLGNALRFMHIFDEAIKAYENFKTYLDVYDIFFIDLVNREIQATRNASELVLLPIKLDSENLGTEINSSVEIENCPVISDDESVLVYTAGQNNNFSPDIALDLINFDYEMDKIYFTQKVDTTWSDPININDDIKVGEKAVPVTMSKDGKVLYIAQDDNDNGNIYTTHYVDGKWTPIKRLNKNINSRQWESHASLTVEGTVLYFTSDRDGGYGGLDIYKSVLDENDDWGPAENLGPTINSIYDEETPFILNDGKTLYFSSQGHYSMGGFDVFHSKLLEDGKWSTPLNLGYPINTVGNDLFYLPKSNGEYAFFPLNNNERGFGGNDIYKIMVVTPESGTTEINLKGLITLQDRKPVLPENSVVYVIDKTTYDTIVKITPELQSGDYSTIINSGDFKLLYASEGYFEHEENLFIPDIYTRTDVVINVELIPLQVTTGEYVVIRSIFFNYGKHDLRRESKIELEKLGKLMQENPSLYVEVIGHTDSKSSAEFNQKLSEKRSRSAIDYLVNMGISVERFVSTGLGETQHVAINTNVDGTENEEGMQLNRRVEIKILKSDDNLVIVEDIHVPPRLRKRKDVSIHSILVTTSKVPLTKNDFAAKDPEGLLKDIRAINGEDEILYALGEYKEKSEALKLFNKILDLGFTGTKIVDNFELDEMKPKSLVVDINVNDTSQTYVTPTTNDGGKVYTIQLKALSKPINLNYFKNLKGVKENLCADGYYRYTYLEITDPVKAREERQKVIELGYHGAFIVLNKQFSQIKDKKGEFTIQLKSLTKPVNIGVFRGLTGVKEHIANNGLYKYTYGTYSSMSEAKKDLKKVAKKGYPDAFVINVEKYNN